jgi:hypothetical protein
MGEVKVVTDALRTEAKRWEGFSDQLEAIHKGIGELNLEQTAFWCGPPTSILMQPVYEEFRKFVADRCNEGFQEFEQIAGALKRAADEYDGSDEVSAKTLAKIYGGA